jgi:HEAT repeat protein
MKKGTVLLTVAVILTLAVPAMALDYVLPQNANKPLIEENLICGLRTDNQSVQRSCILILGQIQSERAVIPLMSILHNSPEENLRLAAAWSLCRIGDARGVYAVKMAVKFDESSKVRVTSAWYYEQYVKQGTFIISPKGTSM